MERSWEVTGRRGRRRKQLPHYLKENTGYCNLKEEAVDRPLWRTGFRRGCGHVIRQTIQSMKELLKTVQCVRKAAVHLGYGT
jgi:hypothetical protein